MGLKQDLIDAKKEGLRLSGANDEAIQQAQDTLETQCELEVESIVNFLTSAEFRITQLNAPVIVEDFKIPPQQGDVLPQVVSLDTPYPGGIPVPPIPIPLQGGMGGVLNKAINISRDAGGLQSTGYVYIGEDPYSQDSFNVEDEDGQIDFTTVKLIREDIEELL